MNKLDEEYYHRNMYSWEELVSECIGLEDTVAKLRSENDNHVSRIKNLVKANVRFIEVNDKLKADNFHLQKAVDEAETILVDIWENDNVNDTLLSVWLRTYRSNGI